MTSQLKTILFDKKFALILFVLIHLFLININTAEWGDSYRILRASQYIRKGAYPADEKRPPFFSALLAIRPDAVDPVFWGRLTMFVVSTLYFLVFSKFSERHIKDRRLVFLSKLLFIFNPVLLYWSLRVMSDVLFAFLSLLAIFLLDLWSQRMDVGKSILLGFIVGLSILTRFEGYLLLAAVLVGVSANGFELSAKNFNVKKISGILRKNLVNSLVFVFMTFMVLIPYLISSNPLSSSYLEEPAGRTYDLKMVLIYFVSLFSLFGFVPAMFFIFSKFRMVFGFFIKNLSVGTFVLLELILILLWPAAIPRIFSCIIPFLIVALVLAIKQYLENDRNNRKVLVIANLLLLIFYIASQAYLKLQFLIPQKYWFVAVVAIQILIILMLYLRKNRVAVCLLTVSAFVWALSPIILHKDNFISVQKAAEYASDSLKGVVAYNDVSSVSDWYLNQKKTSDGVSGFYYNMDKSKNLDAQRLEESGADYLLITNEHNTTMSLDLGKRPYLEEIKDFRYNIGGKEFFAKIVKVNKEALK